MSRAACRNNPLLPVSAWDDFHRGRPGEFGLQAMVVCRFACPVLKECQERFRSGSMVETIAAGGWFDRNGALREGNLSLFGVELAATYLGVEEKYISRRTGKGRGFVVAHRQSGRTYFARDNVLAVAARHRLTTCGTEKAARLHQLRGEWPCQRCRSVRQRNGFLAA